MKQKDIDDFDRYFMILQWDEIYAVKKAWDSKSWNCYPERIWPLSGELHIIWDERSKQFCLEHRYYEVTGQYLHSDLYPTSNTAANEMKERGYHLYQDWQDWIK